MFIIFVSHPHLTPSIPSYSNPIFVIPTETLRAPNPSCLFVKSICKDLW